MAKDFTASVTLFFKDAFSGGMQKAVKSFAGMKSSLSDIGRDSGMLRLAADISMTAGMTEPFRQKLSQALAEPSHLAEDLEGKMAAVRSVLTESNADLGGITKTYGALKAAAIDWSKSHRDTAESFTRTSYAMLSAGLNASQAVEATRKAMILARATMGETSEAGNLLAVVYNNMGNKSADVQTEMGRLADILAKTQATFQIANLGQLTEGLKYGIPVAQQFGVSISQLSTIIGQLNTAGLQGSMAGTAFGSMMAQMLKAQKSLKFEIAYDPSGGMDVIKTLQNIQKRYGVLESLSVEAKQSFQKAFGVEGLRALTLLSGSLKDLQNNYQGVANSTGTASQMAASMADTFADSMERWKNNVDAFQTKMGEGANAVKRRFADMGSALFRALSFLNKIPGLNRIPELAGVAALAGNTMLKFGGTALNSAAQLATVAAMSEKAGGFMNLFKNSMSLLTTPLKMAGGLMGKFASSIFGVGKAFIAQIPAAVAFIAANWPIFALVGAVALLAFGAYMLVKHWDKVKAFFQNLWAKVVGFFTNAWEFIKGIFNRTPQWVFIAVAAFMPFIGIPLLIIKNWKKIVTFFKDLIDVFKKAGAALWNAFTQGLKSAISAPFKAIKSGLGKIRKLLPSSDAQEGPLSDISYSGRSLVSTFAEGVRKESSIGSTLEHALGSFLPKAKNIVSKGGFHEENRGTTNIFHIKHITIQGKDIENIVDFVTKLQDAVGVA